MINVLGGQLAAESCGNMSANSVFFKVYTGQHMSMTLCQYKCVNSQAQEVCGQKATALGQMTHCTSGGPEGDVVLWVVVKGCKGKQGSSLHLANNLHIHCVSFSEQPETPVGYLRGNWSSSICQSESVLPVLLMFVCFRSSLHALHMGGTIYTLK